MVNDVEDRHEFRAGYSERLSAATFLQAAPKQASLCGIRARRTVHEKTNMENHRWYSAEETGRMPVPVPVVLVPVPGLELGVVSLESFALLGPVRPAHPGNGAWSIPGQAARRRHRS